MIFQKIAKKNIINEVKNSIKDAKKEIVMTMLFSEEILTPLPKEYHSIIHKKLEEGISVKRLGYGSAKEFYDSHKRLSYYNMQNYAFRFESNVLQYQRLVVVDKKILYLKIDKSFYKTTNKFIIGGFKREFNLRFKRGKYDNY